MSNMLSCLKSDWKYLSLSALAGAAVATGIAVLLVADKVGGVQLVWWQIAAIYVALMAGGVLLAQKGCKKEPSLYEKLGGEAAVNAAVDVFYRKVLADSRINQFFEGVDMRKQAAKQKAFLAMVFGGPNKYTGEDLRKGHAHLVARGLADSHFDAVMEHLDATLAELKVPPELIARAAAIAESTRKDVLGK